MGLIVYVVSGMVPEASAGAIFKAVTWFILPVLLCIGLIIAFPQIATFLPNLF